MRAHAVSFHRQKWIYFNQRPFFDREVRGGAKKEREIKIKMRTGDLKTRRKRHERETCRDNERER